MKLVRRVHASEFIQTIWLTAIMTVLATRFYLTHLVNYFQLGGGEWHIAHVLWGGLLMLGGALLTLSFHGNKIRQTSSVLIGIGLGWFVDEAGKFLTQDNNYLFKPATVVIYLVFVAIYLFYRQVEKMQKPSIRSALYQSLEQLEEFLEGDFQKKEKSEVLVNLTYVKKNKGRFGLFARRLIEVVKQLGHKPDKSLPWWKQGWQKAWTIAYRNTLKKTWFLRGLGGFFLVHAVVSAISVTNTIQYWGDPLFIQYFYKDWIHMGGTNESMLVFKVISELVSGAIMVWGTLRWRHGRVAALEVWKTGLLVKIFVTHVFAFYFEQFSAIFSLGVDIVILAGLTRLQNDLKNG